MKNKKFIYLLVAIVAVVAIVFATKNLNKNDNEKIEETEEVLKEDSKETSEITDQGDIKADEGKTESEDVDIFEEIAIGKPMRDFIVKNKKGEVIKLKNLDGEEVTLEDYKGKIVFINFWATWCTFCDAEMPDLQRIQDENDDVVVLAVNVAEDKKAVEKYMNKGGYRFEQVILDEDSLLAQDVYVAGFPSTYFVTKDGIFDGMVPQMITYEQMNYILDEMRSN